jgi:hypothetical protein
VGSFFLTYRLMSRFQPAGSEMCGNRVAMNAIPICEVVGGGVAAAVVSHHLLDLVRAKPLLSLVTGIIRSWRVIEESS